MMETRLCITKDAKSEGKGLDAQLMLVSLGWTKEELRVTKHNKILQFLKRPLRTEPTAFGVTSSYVVMLAVPAAASGLRLTSHVSGYSCARDREK